MPASNRQGAVTNAVCSSHGDDIDSDGACVTGPQPYSEGENESSPVCCRFPLSAGWNRNILVRQGSHPVAGCHGLQAVEEVTAKHKWGTPITEETLLSISAIGDDYPAAREVYADLRSESYITFRGNRGIELDKSNFGDLADVLYYECRWEAWEIKSRLKHYEGIDNHDWA